MPRKGIGSDRWVSLGARGIKSWVALICRPSLLFRHWPFKWEVRYSESLSSGLSLFDIQLKYLTIAPAHCPQMRLETWTSENKDVALKVNSLRYNPLVRRLGTQKPLCKLGRDYWGLRLITPIPAPHYTKTRVESWSSEDK